MIELLCACLLSALVYFPCVTFMHMHQGQVLPVKACFCQTRTLDWQRLGLSSQLPQHSHHTNFMA